MEDLKEDIFNIWSESQKLIEKKIEVTKLEVIEKSLSAGGIIISVVLVIGVSLIFLFLLGITLSLWIGKMLDDYFLGVVITAGFFFLFLIVLIVFRYRLIVNPFKNRQLGKYLENHE